MIVRKKRTCNDKALGLVHKYEIKVIKHDLDGRQGLGARFGL